MNKLNLPPFYIGQKVVYITGISMPKYSRHIVSDIIQDPCGCWVVYINGEKRGMYINKNKYTHIKCNGCGNEFEIHSNLHNAGWVAASFRPVQQSKFPLITLSKIQEVEKEEILIPN